MWSSTNFVKENIQNYKYTRLLEFDHNPLQLQCTLLCLTLLMSSTFRTIYVNETSKHAIGIQWDNLKNKARTNSNPEIGSHQNWINWHQENWAQTYEETHGATWQRFMFQIWVHSCSIKLQHQKLIFLDSS